MLGLFWATYCVHTTGSSKGIEPDGKEIQCFGQLYWIYFKSSWLYCLNFQVDQTPLPLLFMRTVIQAIDAFPALVNFFSDFFHAHLLLLMHFCLLRYYVDVEFFRWYIGYWYYREWDYEYVTLGDFADRAIYSFSAFFFWKYRVNQSFKHNGQINFLKIGLILFQVIHEMQNYKVVNTSVIIMASVWCF